MNIVVLVKQVPDSGSERTLRSEDNTIDRQSVDNVINEMDEYAIEEALTLAASHGGEVTILTMGPEQASDTIRKSLSMGAHKAVHISDPALHGSCAVQTSAVLAKALGTLEWDLVICGAESTDGQVAVMPAMLSERLGVPHLTGARKLTVDGQKLTVERQTDGGYWVLEAQAPAIVSVWDTINEPRYPSFKGIMAAKSKPVTKLTLAELGVEAGEVGLANATSGVLEFANRPPKEAGQVVKDEGDGGAKLADFLAAQKFI
ncbi:MAG: electron transfer flavoprotein subunit beta/FixA family protein [Geodermatophilaceae bacterium]|nr:electron transfer flavoprotein subunit beta/FixA family protein [Geodermatophilaceae bacterium]